MALSVRSSRAKWVICIIFKNSFIALWVLSKSGNEIVLGVMGPTSPPLVYVLGKALLYNGNVELQVDLNIFLFTQVSFSFCLRIYNRVS